MSLATFPASALFPVWVRRRKSLAVDPFFEAKDFTTGCQNYRKTALEEAGKLGLAAEA